MRRREVVAGLATVLLGARDADAQSSLPVIGFLHSASPGPYKHVVSGFLAGLNDRGVVIGRDAALEYRWAEGRYERLPTLASELVELRVAVLAATGGLATAPGLAPWRSRQARASPFRSTLSSSPPREVARRRLQRFEGRCHGKACSGGLRLSCEGSRGSRRTCPLLRSLDSEESQHAAGDEMALEVVGVVDGGVSGEEALR